MAPQKKVLMAASGDLRQSANEICWPAQEAMEKQVASALAAFGVEVERAHPYDPVLKHGFIASQKQGLEIFAGVDPETPIVVAEAVWQYTNHVLPGLIGHRGPILTVANWSGQWPGLVGMLNLNGSLTKAGVPYSTLWSETFADEPFKHKLGQWLSDGRVTHDASHVHAFDPAAAPSRAREVAGAIAADFRRRKAIMGIFDEGCMGMYNAIIPDELLFPLGVFKERLSQSALYAASREVPDAEARAVYDWLVRKGMTFHFGADPADRSDARTGPRPVPDVHRRGANRRDLRLRRHRHPVPAGPEGPHARLRPRRGDAEQRRPPAGREARTASRSATARPSCTSTRWTNAPGSTRCSPTGCIGRSASRSRRPCTTSAGATPTGAAAPRTTSGCSRSPAPRRPPTTSAAGPARTACVSRRCISASAAERCAASPSPARSSGRASSSRSGRLKMDIGRARVAELPKEETERRWRDTTPQWPIMHGVLHGVTRDQMMARHKANHIQVAYANSPEEADLALATKAALAAELGLEVSLCGAKADGSPLVH